MADRTFITWAMRFPGPQPVPLSESPLQRIAALPLKFLPQRAAAVLLAIIPFKSIAVHRLLLRDIRAFACY